MVQVLDYGVDGTTPFLVMELLQGEDLSARLQRVQRLEPQALVEIMQQVERAVQRAHDAGIVHRDLKPENIFLVNEGTHEFVKVLDFGIAKTVSPGFAPAQTRTGVTMGTPYYMSPEQAEGRREVDHRTDLWALGVIASECLTGVRPFDGQTFGELLLNICARPAPVPSTLAVVPRYFDAWFAKATNRDPSQRFASVRELVSTLAEVAAGRMPTGMDGIQIRTAPMEGPALAATPSPATPLRAPTEGNTSVTVDADDVVRIPTHGPSHVPVIAGALMLAVAAAGGYWWWSASSGPAGVAAAVSAEPRVSEDSAAAAAGPSARVVEVVEAASSVPSASAQPRDQARQLSVREPPASTTSPTAEKSASSPSATAPLEASSKTSPSAARERGPTLRCVSDPFTGRLSLAKSGQANAVPCRQNAFTGAYQRQ